MMRMLLLEAFARSDGPWTMLRLPMVAREICVTKIIDSLNVAESVTTEKLALWDD